MCTVTYLPYRDGFILTHNRDEAPTRSPQVISREKHAKEWLIFPKDTKAGGAWIGSTRSGRTACLLNGAFVKHQHRPPYRRSRGLVLLDFFGWSDPNDFFARYDLDGIEPFTLLYFEARRVLQFRWDGAQRYPVELSPAEPHFWCSATLYPPAMQAVREELFLQWLKGHYVSGQDDSRLPATIHHLHATGSVGDPENDYVMNRGGRVCTVSITQVVEQRGQLRMRYDDLLEGFRDTRRLRLSGA